MSIRRPLERDPGSRGGSEALRPVPTSCDAMEIAIRLLNTLLPILYAMSVHWFA